MRIGLACFLLGSLPEGRPRVSFLTTEIDMIIPDLDCGGYEGMRVGFSFSFWGRVGYHHMVGGEGRKTR
jgi:hypothetical protein